MSRSRPGLVDFEAEVIPIVNAKRPTLSTSEEYVPEVLYEDNHLLVLRKPAGMLVQGDETGDTSLLDVGRAWVKKRYGKPGDVFLGLVHRLDRPVSGVVTFARTSKAASRLAAQFRNRQVTKVYWALVQGEAPQSGVLANQLVRRQTRSRVVTSGGDEARLRFSRLGYAGGVSWLEIHLETGRHHQIRVQLAHVGFPIVGDLKYGASLPYDPRAIALHARTLSLAHPVGGHVMTFEAAVEPLWEQRFP
jgi:23S rRNA pseudouridine1911/1915/1917 synthase